MSTFEREGRHVILKIKDIASYLNIEQTAAVILAVNTIDKRRKQASRPPLVGAVVESDWPEYEVVWKMIEERMKNDKISKS